MPRKRPVIARDREANKVFGDIGVGQFEMDADPINIAKEVDGMIVALGEKAAAHASMNADYYRWAGDDEMAEDWDDVRRLILERQQKRSGKPDA